MKNRTPLERQSKFEKRCKFYGYIIQILISVATSYFVVKLLR